MLRSKDRNKLWIPCMDCSKVHVLQEAGKREAGKALFTCSRCGEGVVKAKDIKE